MSHHFDSPTAIEDGRINLCDVFVFPSDPGTTALVLTVNPDAGRSSPTTFRPEAVHEFAIATDGGARADLALRVRFDEPDAQGEQAVRVLRAAGEEQVAAGRSVGSGRTGTAFDLDLGTDLPPGRAWCGLVADPFSADGAALAGFLMAAAEGRDAPELFDGGTDLFAGRDVTAVALQVPDALLGGGRVAAWAQITLTGHAPQRRVSRMGQPMLRPLFFPVPGPDTEELNAGAPATDRERHRGRIAAVVEQLRGPSRDTDPRAAAGAVADAFVPDVLGYRAGAGGGWTPGGDGGRGLGDDVFATALFAVTGRPLGTRTPPAAPAPAFPHLAPPHRAGLPPLAELFGLRAGPSAGG